MSVVRKHPDNSATPPKKPTFQGRQNSKTLEDELQYASKPDDTNVRALRHIDIQ